MLRNSDRHQLDALAQRETRFNHFVKVQNSWGSHESRIAELDRGKKTGHWMWFTFPQLLGTQSSQMSREFGIANLDEAAAYLEHPVLGQRLLEGVLTVQPWTTMKAPEQVFGVTDAEKFHQCMTLFARVSENTIFGEVLNAWFDGEDEQVTRDILDPTITGYVAPAR